MKRIGDILKNFFIGIKVDSITTEDKIKSIKYQMQICKNTFANADIIKLYEDIINAFEGAIKFKCYIEGVTHRATLENSKDIKRFKEDIDYLFTFEDAVEQEIVVNKDELINIIESYNSYLNRNNFDIRIYSCDSEITNLFKDNSIAKLDEILFGENKLNKIIINIQGNLNVNNDYIYIISNPDITALDINKDEWGKSKAFELDKISHRTKLCNWTDATKILMPEHLYFETLLYENTYSELSNTLVNRLLEIIIPSISDFTDVENNKRYSILNGSKKIKIIYETVTHYEFEKIQALYQIYRWMYSEGLNTDKFYIARNLISISLCEICNKSYFRTLLDDAVAIYNSILNNYDKYLIENVEVYFKEKYNAQNMMFNKIESLNNYVGLLIEAMNKNMFTLIGAFLVAVVTYTSKNNIFILQGTGILYGIYLLISSAYYLPFYRYKQSVLKKENQLLKQNFDKILLEKDRPDQTSFEKSCTIWEIYWWVSLLIIVGLLILDIILVFNTQELIIFIKQILLKL